MRLIGITDACFFDREPALIACAFENGLDLLHIRKPDASSADLCRLLSAIPASLHDRLVLHDHFEWCEPFGLRGIHLNRRHAVVPSAFAGTVSRSCHSVSELHSYWACDYLFLSPICDSISKSGYRAGYTAGELQEACHAGLIHERVIALGGITPDAMAYIRRFSFGGVAVLGYLWSCKTEREVAARVAALSRELKT